MGPSPSPRGLSAYLALPLDQYSLLDPSWISRCPTSPDVFVLRVPLFDLVGLELQPQITVRVSVDPRNSQVHFHADQFKVGDPRFDEDFKLAMRATLRNKPVPTLRPLRSIKRMWARAGGRGNTAAGSSGAAGAAAASSVGAAAWQSPSPSATVASGQSGSDSSDNASDADAEDVVVQVVDGDGEDGGGPSVLRDAGGPAYGSGGSSRGRGGGGGLGGRALGNACSVYEPAGVVDVDLGVCGLGPRAAPVVPPHVTVVRGETAGTWAGAGSDTDRVDPLAAVSCDSSDSVSSSSGGVSGNDRSSKGGSSAQQGSPRAVWSVESSNSSISSKSSGDVSADAAPLITYESGGGRGEEYGAQVWLPGAYGPAHPAATTAAAAAPGSAGPNRVSPSRPSVTPATLAPTPSLTPASATSPPSAHPRAEGAAVEAQLARQGVGVGPVAVTVGSTSTPAPASVAAAAAATTPAVSPGPPIGAPSGAGSLPFIEDSVLYMPASQWGRSFEAGRPNPAAAAPTSATLQGHGPWGADVIAAGPGPGGTALRATVAPVHESDHSGRGPAEEPGPAAVPVVTQAATSSAAFVQATAEPGVTSAPPALAGGPAAASSIGAAAGSVPQVVRSDCSIPANTVTSADHSSGAEASGLAAVHCQGRDVAESPSSTNGSSDSNVDSRISSHATAVADAVDASVPMPPGSSGAAALTTAPASASGGASGSASAEEGATALLVGNVDVSVTVMLPPALAAVPRPLLGMTGSIIARYAIASLLPSFLDLLVADYGRWSSGQTVSARAAPAGNLAAVAAANAAAMGVQQGAVRPQQAAPQPQRQPLQPQQATTQHAAAAEPPSVSSTTS